MYILKLPNNRYNKIASIDFVLCYPANVAANRKYYITREYRRMRKTYPANETVWMPLTVQRRYIILHDGTITSTAFRSEHVEVILSAVRLPVPLVKSLFTELFATLGAKEVLRMPSFLQSGNTFLKITRCKLYCIDRNITLWVFRWTNVLRLEWGRYSRRNGERKDCDNRVRNKGVPPFRRNFSSPVPDCSECKWNVLDAKSFPEQWSPAIKNFLTSIVRRIIYDSISFTCPTIGFSQALQHPFCVVFTPWRLISAWRFPSIESNWFCLVCVAGCGG